MASPRRRDGPYITLSTRLFRCIRDREKKGRSMELRSHAWLCPPLSVMNNLAALGPCCRVEMVVMGRLDIYTAWQGAMVYVRTPPPRPTHRRVPQAAHVVFGLFSEKKGEETEIFQNEGGAVVIRTSSGVLQIRQELHFLRSSRRRIACSAAGCVQLICVRHVLRLRCVRTAEPLLRHHRQDVLKFMVDAVRWRQS